MSQFEHVHDVKTGRKYKDDNASFVILRDSEELDYWIVIPEGVLLTSNSIINSFDHNGHTFYKLS